MQSTVRRWVVGPWFGLCACATVAAGCGNFFEELQSADSADSGDTDSDDAGLDGDDDMVEVPGSDCVYPEDGRCVDQDTIQRCDPESAEIEIHGCTEICGGFTNFACVMVSPGEHGCWCVEPGRQKVFSCSELEACLADCGSAATSACADACFARTDQTTVRLYGALVNCAHDGCHEICNETPESCAACVESAIQTGAGACGLARSVCDADDNDELGPFG